MIRQLFKSPVALSKFQLELLQYISIVAPLARSLWSLESSQANAADVYIFWLAIAATLNALFAKNHNATGIEPALAKKVTAVINRRYRSFIDESPSDIYFSAFFLDPRMLYHFNFSYILLSMAQLIFFSAGYSRSDILRKPTTMSTTLVIPAKNPSSLEIPNQSSESVPYPRAFERVKEFLKDILRNEVQLLQKSDPGTDSPLRSFIRRTGISASVDHFRKQLTAYARTEYPFTDALPTNGDTRQWWENLAHHPHAHILAVRFGSFMNHV